VLREIIAPGAGRAMIAGGYPGLSLAPWASLFERVYLHAFEPDDAPAATLLRRLWEGEIQTLDDSLERRVSFVADKAAALPNRSVDLLYLPGEASAERLAAGAAFWRRTLKAEALVCGDLYGVRDWPDATAAIVQMFGPPRQHDVDFWWKRLSRTSPFRCAPSRYGMLTRLFPALGRTKAARPLIPVIEDSTIVTLVEEKTLEHFSHAWRQWNFAAEVPIVIAYANLACGCRLEAWQGAAP